MNWKGYASTLENSIANARPDKRGAVQVQVFGLEKIHPFHRTIELANLED